MFIDALLLVSDAQAVTVDAVSTHTIDLGGTNKRIGNGVPLVFFITLDVAADITDLNETYSFQVIQSASANLSTPDVLAVRTIAAADLKAGVIQSIGIPIGTPTKQYLGLNYDTGGTTPSLTVTAGVVPQSFVAGNVRVDNPGVF